MPITLFFLVGSYLRLRPSIPHNEEVPAMPEMERIASRYRCVFPEAMSNVHAGKSSIRVRTITLLKFETDESGAQAFLDSFNQWDSEVEPQLIISPASKDDPPLIGLSYRKTFPWWDPTTDAALNEGFVKFKKTKLLLWLERRNAAVVIYIVETVLSAEARGRP